MQGKQLNLNVASPSQVKLFDLAGHALMEAQVSAGSSALSLSKIPSGVYMVQIRSEGKMETHKIRVE
jgi:hypothetical protein